MGACCGGHEEEEAVGIPGPDIQRRCTNVPCLLLFVLFCGGFVALYFSVRDCGSLKHLQHGRDHYGRLCGYHADVEHLSNVFFPDLGTDIQIDSSLTRLYGICVSECPVARSTVLEPSKPKIAGKANSTLIQQPRINPGDPWYVVMPSVSVIGRCIPFNPQQTKDDLLMCADPPCNMQKENPKEAQDVCGVKADKTERFWLMGPPDNFTRWGWKEEGATPQQIATRVDILKRDEPAGKPTTDRCNIFATRSPHVSIHLKSESSVLKFVEHITGAFFREAMNVASRAWFIIGVGIGGSLIASIVILTLVTCMARCILVVLWLGLLCVLVGLDYYFFVQAGIAHGSSSRYVASLIQKATGTLNDKIHVAIPDNFQNAFSIDIAIEDASLESSFEVIAWLTLVIVIIFICVSCSMKRQFGIVVALMTEAARTIREMPSLVVFPFFPLLSLTVSCSLLLWLLLNIVAMERFQTVAFLQEHMPWLHVHLSQDPANFQDAQKLAMFIIFIGFLWIFVFHIAFFTVTTAMAVSHWYFYRDDPERSAGAGIHSDGWFFGRPMLVASWCVCRYHLGSCAAGSFLMVVCTLPRLAFEYLSEQTKGAQEANPALKCFSVMVRCLLWTLHKFLQHITSYAYVFVAMSGKPFCKSAHKSFVLTAKYPVEMTLHRVASNVFGYLILAIVSLGCGIIAYLFCGKANDSKGIVAVVVVLAYMSTRIAVGVYDVTLATLFVCAVEDSEKFGGRYMTETLRTALGLSKDDEDSNLRRDAELS
eukprot:TRINITY_DN9065_c0_g1_i1.p1 TRINITY_DN9065_c0_g1~~TRINITY_DN9065_c0_g1_i1.p1  ORF type:complete len:764 (+),score=69.37 TRINITY_DN9065_c0_g1_i1:91-2382(+)